MENSPQNFHGYTDIFTVCVCVCVAIYLAGVPASLCVASAHHRVVDFAVVPVGPVADVTVKDW